MNRTWLPWWRESKEHVFQVIVSTDSFLFHASTNTQTVSQRAHTPLRFSSRFTLHCWIVSEPGHVTERGHWASPRSPPDLHLTPSRTRASAVVAEQWNCILGVRAAHLNRFQHRFCQKARTVFLQLYNIRNTKKNKNKKITDPLSSNEKLDMSNTKANH